MEQRSVFSSCTLNDLRKGGRKEGGVDYHEGVMKKKISSGGHNGEFTAERTFLFGARISSRKGGKGAKCVRVEIMVRT